MIASKVESLTRRSRELAIEKVSTFQISNTDTAMPVGHALHLAVEGADTETSSR